MREAEKSLFPENVGQCDLTGGCFLYKANDWQEIPYGTGLWACDRDKILSGQLWTAPARRADALCCAVFAWLKIVVASSWIYLRKTAWEINRGCKNLYAVSPLPQGSRLDQIKTKHLCKGCNPNTEQKKNLLNTEETSMKLRINNS